MTNKVSIALIFFLITFSSCSVIKFTQIYRSSNKEKGKLVNHVYNKNSTSYKIGRLNDNWNKVSTDKGDLFFVSKANDATINVNSVCSSTKINSSLYSLSQSLLIGLKQKKLLRRNSIHIDDEEALLLIHSAKLGDIELKIATVVLVKGGCVYDVTYSNIGNSFDLYFKDFMEFIGNFSVITK